MNFLLMHFLLLHFSRGEFVSRDYEHARTDTSPACIHGAETPTIKIRYTMCIYNVCVARGLGLHHPICRTGARFTPPHLEEVGENSFGVGLGVRVWDGACAVCTPHISMRSSHSPSLVRVWDGACAVCTPHISMRYSHSPSLVRGSCSILLTSDST